ncbi:MAG: RHS repeat-associated core domain-containing protein [Pirellulales bacterium]
MLPRFFRTTGTWQDAHHVNPDQLPAGQELLAPADSALPGEPLNSYNTSTNAYTASGPFTVADVDWMGRSVATARYITAPTWTTVIGDDDYAATIATNRRTLDKSFYDELGRVYRTEFYKISAADGSTVGCIQTNNYYNRNGQLVATQQAYGAAREMAYDGLGRQYTTRTVIDLEATKYVSGAFAYRDPQPNSALASMTGGDDQMLEFTNQEYDTAGNVIAVHNLEMTHADTNGLNVGTAASFVRATSYNWYDAAKRLTTAGNYGTAHGSNQWGFASIPTRPGTAPTASSSSVLVTKYGYDSTTGRQDQVTDPIGKVSKTYYDAAGRTTYVVDNYADFNASTEANSGGGTNGDQDQVVKTIYNAAGQVTELVALDRTGDGLTTTNDNESTKYLYEDTNDASLVTNEIYPDSSDTASSGTDQVKKEYFFNGQLKRKTDQRGVVIDYEYNADRALEWEKVTTLPSGVDGTVRSIQRTYDSLRRPLEVRSFATSTGTTYVNEIEYTYDDNLGVKFSYQDHDSAVSTGSTPYVSYFYDVSAVSGVFDDGLRRYAYGLPSGGGYVWEYYTSTIADRLNRIEAITETFSTGTSKDIASYAYNGTGRLVSVSYAQPAFKLLRDEGSDGTYEHLDQFGRVKVQHWKANGGSTVDRVEYTYDYASNRTLRDIPSSLYGTNNLDQTYGYDGLNRLKNFDQGVYTTSIASPTQEQDWTLDMLGNWSNLLEKTSGSTTLNQNRTHNNANEIATIAGASTYVGHDAAGNMTKIPKPTNWSAAYDLVFDPWNRIVQVKDGGSTVATYGYDGLHRRITKTVGGTTEQHYYNENWQCVEVRIGTESGPARQKYIWHPYYIDALACRFADVDSNGNFSGTDEVEFPTHDANFNVSGLVNASGTVFERYYYSPYGKLSVLDANFAADADGASDVANAFTYTGRQFDNESGIYQYRHRYYHAQLGRFVARDPIGYQSSANFYENVASNPAAFLDPFGLEIFDYPDPDRTQGNASIANIDITASAENLCGIGPGVITINIVINVHAGAGPPWSGMNLPGAANSFGEIHIDRCRLKFDEDTAGTPPTATAGLTFSYQVPECPPNGKGSLSVRMVDLTRSVLSGRHPSWTGVSQIYRVGWEYQCQHDCAPCRMSLPFSYKVVKETENTVNPDLPDPGPLRTCSTNSSTDTQ